VATRKLETTPEDARAFLARLRAALPVHGAAEPDLDRAIAAVEHHRIQEAGTRAFWPRSYRRDEVAIGSLSLRRAEGDPVTSLLDL
jgi:hypothetical protein